MHTFISPILTLIYYFFIFSIFLLSLQVQQLTLKTSYHLGGNTEQQLHWSSRASCTVVSLSNNPNLLLTQLLLLCDLHINRVKRREFPPFHGQHNEISGRAVFFFSSGCSLLHSAEPVLIGNNIHLLTYLHKLPENCCIDT